MSVRQPSYNDAYGDTMTIMINFIIIRPTAIKKWWYGVATTTTQLIR